MKNLLTLLLWLLSASLLAQTGTPRDITYLESRFETGDKPSEADFEDVFASFLHYLQVQQSTGSSTSDVMSQNAITTALSAKQNTTTALTNFLALGTTGIVVKTAGDAWVTRSIAAGNGMTVTNGDGASGNMNIILGGLLTADVNFDNQFNYSWGATTPINQFTVNTHRDGGIILITKGVDNNSMGFQAGGVVSGLFRFFDNRGTKRGIEYQADGYVTQARSLADKGYVDAHLGGEAINSLISSPAAGQDGYNITWDNTAGEYTLTDPASATPTLDDILEAGASADLSGGVDVTVNGTGTLFWQMDATGNQHYFQSNFGGGETSVSFRVTDPYMITESGGGWRIQFENEASSWDNVVEGVATIRKTISDGVGANGIGARIFLGAETGTENNYRYGFFDFVFSDATYASADGYFSFSPVEGGANVEVLRITGTGLEVNGVALNETDVIDRVSASTAGGTITLDLASKKQRMFYGSASFATAKTIALSNTTNALVFSFDFSITDLAAVLTMPASFTMDDDRFDGDDWTATETGDYEMVGSLNNAGVWKVKIAGPFN